jgi:predicted anti-sigma-YlaC factor YlaD
LCDVTQPLEIDCRRVWRELVNYTEGDLTPEMRDRIARHLPNCLHCRAVYHGSRNIVRLLDDKNAFELPRGFSRRLYERLSSGK